MKYKQQIQNRTEAILNLLHALERDLNANAISKKDAVQLVSKIKSIISQISNYTDLED